jgi:single-stranded-DNA-specific exonuclease
MEKKWNVVIDGRGKDSLQIIDEILEARGIEDVEQFLNPTEEDLVPFEQMRNIDKAAQVILDGVENDKKFFVHWDVDVDGCSAGAIATKYLQYLGAEVETGINEGKAHGIQDLDLSLMDGIDILWIVDSIQKDIEPYLKVLECGVEKIVITDHHDISKELQDEMAENGNIILVSSVVDYPNPAASGSVVTWKLCNYLDWIELDDFSESLMELAATGAVADMCSVGTDSMENRYICSKGFSNTSNPGIKKINGGYEMNSQAVSFGIAPRVNAANRVNRNDLAMDLFMKEDNKEVLSIVKGLNECRELQNAVVSELMPDLLKQGEEQINKKVMYFFLPSDIDAEVAGLLGNKLLERYQRPLFVLRQKFVVDEETGEITGEEFSGSSRAIGVEDFKHYVACTGIGWQGGHPNAFGCGIPVKDFKQFQEFLEDMLADVEFVQETLVDVRLDAEQITEDFVKKLKAINKISGSGFPSINVMIDGITDYYVGYLSNGKHLKIETPNVTLIKWNCSDEIELGQEISAIGTLDLSWFARRLTKQLIMSDFKVEETL